MTTFLCLTIRVYLISVTVYLAVMKRFDLAIKFQYNSCYCLSNNRIIGNGSIKGFQYNSCYCLSIIGSENTDCFSFQYNSCYCLSAKRKNVVHNHVHFNTTLVTVYRLINFHLGFSILYFNTTLVTVYLNKFLANKEVALISIQLLLLFIQRF